MSVPLVGFGFRFSPPTTTTTWLCGCFFSHHWHARICLCVHVYALCVACACAGTGFSSPPPPLCPHHPTPFPVACSPARCACYTCFQAYLPSLSTSPPLSCLVAGRLAWAGKENCICNLCAWHGRPRSSGWSGMADPTWVVSRLDLVSP